MTIIKKFEPEKQEPKFPKFWVGLVSIFLFCLVLISIWVNTATVSYGSQFEELEVMQQQLLMENQILENEIAKNASLINISSKSAELGFVSPKSVQYIR
mgnify:CR=1 FL=1